MVLALSSTISWSKVDCYYGVPVPHKGYTGFQGTVHWTLSGSRGAVQALRVLFNGINECCSMVFEWYYVVLRCSPAPHKVLYRLSRCC